MTVDCNAVPKSGLRVNQLVSRLIRTPAMGRLKFRIYNLFFLEKDPLTSKCNDGSVAVFSLVPDGTLPY
jgi:hypothetical protein